MRVYQTNEIKNIALLGSAGSGKTTLAESMLFEAGVIKRRGSVEAKNTVSDYFPVELEYGYSVFPTVFHVEWNNKKLNIIDCPGSDDFVGGAITSLNVTDQAVILINGQYGPEVGTQNNFRYTEKLNKPVIFLVNQLDSDKCDFDNLIATMKDIYGSKCVQIQYPIETGPGFNALIDVLLMKKYSWKPEGGAPIIEDIPEEEMDKAMIQNWNDRVTGNDTVYILGDMFFRSTNAEGILKRLKGKKRLIVGNHDGSWMTKFDYARYFFSVDKFLETSDGKRSLTLCHYPMLSWKHAKRSYMIHGHIHNDTRADFWPLIAARENVLNAGVDINSFKPVTFDELLENNRHFKENSLAESYT